MTTFESITNNKFPKDERLCSRKSIEALFQGGDGIKSVSAFPLRAVFTAPLPAPPVEDVKTHILFSVSKRRLHHAVDRNRAKRQLREAWRLNRQIIPQDINLNIAILWLANSPQPTQLIHRKMKNLLYRISETCLQQH